MAPVLVSTLRRNPPEMQWESSGEKQTNQHRTRETAEFTIFENFKTVCMAVSLLSAANPLKYLV